MSETFSAFAGASPPLTLPLLPTDVIVITRFGASYKALSVALFTPPYVYYVPTTGSTITAGAGLFAAVSEPANPLDSLNLVLPPLPLDGQVFEFSTTQTITALNVTGGTGETVLGGSQMLTANGGVSWRYCAATTKWYRRY